MHDYASLSQLSTHSLTSRYIRVIEFMQWNTKSNYESQHHKYKLSITQKSQLMSICLRLKHKLYITKEWLSSKCYNSHASYKIYNKRDYPSLAPLRLKRHALVVVLQIVCNGVILRITNTCIQRSSIYMVVMVATSV
jgi:hypothetical protein